MSLRVNGFEQRFMDFIRTHGEYSKKDAEEIIRDIRTEFYGNGDTQIRPVHVAETNGRHNDVFPNMEDLLVAYEDSDYYGFEKYITNSDSRFYDGSGEREEEIPSDPIEMGLNFNNDQPDVVVISSGVEHHTSLNGQEDERIKEERRKKIIEKAQKGDILSKKELLEIGFKQNPTIIVSEFQKEGVIITYYGNFLSAITVNGEYLDDIFGLDENSENLVGAIDEEPPVTREALRFAYRKAGIITGICKDDLKAMLQRPYERDEEKDEKKRRLIRALELTTEMPAGDTNYLDSTLRQRLGGIEGAGSWFENMDEDELLEELVSDDTQLTEYTPEGALPGCTYYKVNIPGKNGIADIDDLPEDSPLYLSITHAGTGRLSVSTTQKMPAKDETETTIILGQEEGVGEVMFTLHPGLPVAPSDLTLDGLKEQYPELRGIIEEKSSELLAEGKDRDDVVLQITREQAKSLGFDMAKLTFDELARRLEEQQIDVRNVERKGISLGEIKNAVDSNKEQTKPYGE